jgi:hypothetical protein
MSKPEDQGKDLVKEIHKSLKEESKAKWNGFLGALHDIYMFVKFLVGFTFAVAIGFLGTYAILKGLADSNWLKQYAFVVSGVCAVLQSLELMWKLVIKRK